MCAVQVREREQYHHDTCTEVVPLYFVVVYPSLSVCVWAPGGRGKELGLAALWTRVQAEGWPSLLEHTPPPGPHGETRRWKQQARQ